MHLTRRKFNRLSILSGAALLNESPEMYGILDISPDTADESRLEAKTEAPDEKKEIQEKDKSRVAIVKTSNREYGIARAVEMIEKVNFSGKNVYLKGSYNSPDPFPATTHPDALGAMARMLRGKGAGGVTLVERSGMGRTRDVLEKLNVLAALIELDVSFRPLDELSSGEWRHFAPTYSHWPKGFEFPRFLMRSNSCIVQLCNLKTHRFGGVFSASLKNSIGLIAKYAATAESGLTERGENYSVREWNYMKDLHASPYQGQMIAEANLTYVPELVIMDAIKVFIEGGPERGEAASPEIIAASRDRVALDAVGLAILIYAGAKIGIYEHVFEQAQLRRAAELNLGVNSREKISVVSDDSAGQLLASRLESIL